MDKDAATGRDPNAQMPHRIHRLLTSVLRKSGSGVQNKRNMSFQTSQERDKPVETFQHTIESWKKGGLDLWYSAPGSTVHCNYCQTPLPQQCGTLQGCPERSQFAQLLFMCQQCSSDPLKIQWCLDQLNS
ncbi:unnamed protein product [Symbiodinium sp. CCMP2592]|nr:unnamed protein product [Symbiodinium sp. CCMP2592]